MANWKDRLQQGAIRFTYGRNGLDELTWTLDIAGILAYIIGILAGLAWLRILALALILYGTFRTMSKKIDARSLENDAFLRMTKGPRLKVVLLRAKWKNRKTHKCFACKHCGQIVRVPKGKGKVSITCPCCGATFTKKS